MMKYVTPLNVFLYFVVLGLVGTAFIEYVFWTKHMFYEYATALIFALFPLVGGIASALTGYLQRKGK